MLGTLRKWTTGFTLKRLSQIRWSWTKNRKYWSWNRLKRICYWNHDVSYLVELNFYCDSSTEKDQVCCSKKWIVSNWCYLWSERILANQLVHFTKQSLHILFSSFHSLNADYFGWFQERLLKLTNLRGFN